MIVRLLSILVFLNIPVATLAKQGCSIKTFESIILVNDTNRCPKIVNESNCHHQIVNEFLKRIHNISGIIPANIIAEDLKEKYHLKYAPNITPKQIKVSKIGDIVKQELKLTNGLKIKEVNLLGNQCFKKGKQTISISAQCKSCDSPGSANIQLNFNDSKTGKTTVNWASAKLIKRIKVYRAKRNLTAFMSRISTKDFEEHFIETDRPRKYLQTIEDINFYRLNRQLSQNDVLETSSVTPIKLVHTGRKTKVILKVKNMTVESSGIARQSGILGETIELINPKNKKKIIGKIVDFNKVKVEL